MAVIADIKDEKSFKAWLKDKPIEWAQVLASRAALRVAPFGFLESKRPYSENFEITPRHLTVLVFRSTLISRVAIKYPTRDMRRATSAATSAAARAADAAFAATSAASAAASAENQVWAAIRIDCEFLEQQSAILTVIQGGDDISKEEAEHKLILLIVGELLSAPLWHDEELDDFFDSGMPSWVQEPFDEFAQSELANETSFGLIVDWYRDVCRGGKQTVFKGKTDLEIAEQPKEFWEGNPVEVMDRVAKIAGWERRETKTRDSIVKAFFNSTSLARWKTLSGKFNR